MGCLIKRVQVSSIFFGKVMFFIGFDYTDKHGKTGRRTMRCRGNQVETGKNNFIELGAITHVTFQGLDVDLERLHDEYYIAQIRRTGRDRHTA